MEKKDLGHKQIKCTDKEGSMECGCVREPYQPGEIQMRYMTVLSTLYDDI